MITVLWLDDDAPNSERQFGEVLVRTAQNCLEAAKHLDSEAIDWVVVDLVVPQAGWGAEYYQFPGIQFIDYVSTQFGGRIRTALYSIALSPERSAAALQAGATIAASKRQIGLSELLSQIVEYSAAPARLAESLARHIDGNGNAEEGLRHVIEALTEAQLSLGRRLSPREIQALHLAKLAADRQDVEERQRSLQTLVAILERASGQGSESSDYDVFLSYRRADVETVRLIAQRLVSHGITPWFDLWAVRAGDTWVNKLQSALPSISTALVFIGPSGVGPWQDVEVQVLLKGMVDSSQHVIPVVLPGCDDGVHLPPFLKIINKVQLSADLDVQPLVDAIQSAR